MHRTRRAYSTLKVHPRERADSPMASMYKVVVVVLLVALFAAGVYWRFRAPEASVPAGPAKPLAQRSLDELGPLSPHDREVLERGEALFRQGRHAEALATFNGWQTQDDGPGHLRAALFSGGCLLAMGNAPEAERVFRHVVAVKPDEVDAHRALASVYEFLGLSVKAEEHLLKVAELEPTDYQSLKHLAASYLDMKFFPPAEEAIRRALDRKPPTAAVQELRRDLGEALLGQKKFEEAADAVKNDTNPLGGAIRAEAFRNLAKPADADREIEAALGRNSPDAKLVARLYHERGLVRMDLGEAGGAVLAFEESLKRDEHHLASRLQLAQALRRTGQLERAAVEDAKFRDTEARIKRVSELNQKAIEHPSDAAVRRELAEACVAIGRADLAEVWRRAADAIDPPKN